MSENSSIFLLPNYKISLLLKNIFIILHNLLFNELNLVVNSNYTDHILHGNNSTLKSC